MSFKKSSNKTNNDSNVNFKNVNIGGVGFINNTHLYISKEGEQTLVAELALQQGKQVGDNYDDVDSVFFSAVVFEAELKKTLIEGLFDDVDLSKPGKHTASSEQPLRGGFSMSDIRRVDIVNFRPCIFTSLIGVSYLSLGNDLLIDNRKSAK